jgi:hypothetical protein
MSIIPALLVICLLVIPAIVLGYVLLEKEEETA